jgi:hypothetical protein
MIEDRVSGQKLSATLADLTTMGNGKGIYLDKPPAPLVAPIGDGVVDDSTAILAIENYCRTNYLDMIIPSKTYKMTQTLNWDGGRYSIRGVGKACLDFSSMSSGYAINALGQNTSTEDAYDNSAHVFSNIKVKGLDNDVCTVDAFHFEDGYNGSMLTLLNVIVLGFRDQFVYGSTEWIIRMIACSGARAHRYIHNYLGLANSLENISYYGCAFYNAHNANNNAEALHVATSVNLDANFFGCSFDYNDIEGKIHGGQFTFEGCHIEDRSPNPMFSLIADTSSIPSLHFSGGKILPAETVVGRDHIIDTTGANIVITISGTMIDGYNKSLELIKSLDTNIPKLNLNLGLLSTGGTGNPYTYPSKLLNRFVNGDFETGNLNGWTQNLGTYPFTVQGTTVHGGTNALSVASGTSFGWISQKFNCKPGESFLVRGWKNITTLTGGSIYLRAITYDQAGNQVGVPTLELINAVTSGWVGIGGKYTIPAGVANVEIQIYVTGFTGQAYFDDLVVNWI